MVWWSGSCGWWLFLPAQPWHICNSLDKCSVKMLSLTFTDSSQTECFRIQNSMELWSNKAARAPRFKTEPTRDDATAGKCNDAPLSSSKWMIAKAATTYHIACTRYCITKQCDTMCAASKNIATNLLCTILHSFAWLGACSAGKNCGVACTGFCRNKWPLHGKSIAEVVHNRILQKWVLPNQQQNVRSYKDSYKYLTHHQILLAAYQMW